MLETTQVKLIVLPTWKNFLTKDNNFEEKNGISSIDDFVAKCDLNNPFRNFVLFWKHPGVAILFWNHFIASLATELIGSLYSGWEVVAKKGTKANQNNQTKKGTKANKFVFRQVASLISAWESSGDELKDDQGKNHLHVHLWSTQYDCFRLWGTSVFNWFQFINDKAVGVPSGLIHPNLSTCQNYTIWGWKYSPLTLRNTVTAIGGVVDTWQSYSPLRFMKKK